PREQTEEVLALMREELVREARGRQERIESLEREVATLARERAELLGKLAAPPVVAAGAAPTGRDRGGERVRRGLVQPAEDGSLTQATVSLAPEDLYVLQLVETLYKFALAVTTASQRFVKIGGWEFDGSILVDFDRVVRDTFKGCAEGWDGYFKRLDDLLK